MRRLRSLSFAPVGVRDREQHRDLGEVLVSLGVADDIDEFAETVVRVETDLLWARDRGLAVPAYVTRAFREAVGLAGPTRPPAAGRGPRGS